MPVAIELSTDPDLTLLIMSGTLTRGDLAEVVRALASGRIRLDRNVLNYYLADASLHELSANAIIDHREAMVAAAKAQGGAGRPRSAHVGANARDAALLELWQGYSEASGAHPTIVRQFEALPEALAWLGLDAGQAERLRERLAGYDVA